MKTVEEVEKAMKKFNRYVIKFILCLFISSSVCVCALIIKI
jgi:hypothetical protein